MSETQDDVMQWHRSVFGDGDVLRTAKKLLEEASEAHCAAKLGAHFATPEVVDTAVACYALAGICGFDLEYEVRNRVADLRRRPDQKQRDKERGIDP